MFCVDGVLGGVLGFVGCFFFCWGGFCCGVVFFCGGGIFLKYSGKINVIFSQKLPVCIYFFSGQL